VPIACSNDLGGGKFFRIYLKHLDPGLFTGWFEPAARRARTAERFGSSLAKPGASAAALSCSQPVRIMPLGDSITRAALRLPSGCSLFLIDEIFIRV
jgi:hypothetical protein